MGSECTARLRGAGATLTQPCGVRIVGMVEIFGRESRYLDVRLIGNVMIQVVDVFDFGICEEECQSLTAWLGGRCGRVRQNEIEIPATLDPCHEAGDTPRTLSSIASNHGQPTCKLNSW